MTADPDSRPMELSVLIESLFSPHATLVRDSFPMWQSWLALALISAALLICMQASSSQAPCVTSAKKELGQVYLLSCYPWSPGRVFSLQPQEKPVDRQTDNRAEWAPGWSVFLSVGEVPWEELGDFCRGSDRVLAGVKGPRWETWVAEKVKMGEAQCLGRQGLAWDAHYSPREGKLVGKGDWA